MAICPGCGKHEPWLEDGEWCSECEWVIVPDGDDGCDPGDDAGEYSE
jgi:hypothetical protein